jgi:hypothetical protein
MVTLSSNNKSRGNVISTSVGVLRRRHPPPQQHHPTRFDGGSCHWCSVRNFLLLALAALGVTYYRVSVYLLHHGGGGEAIDPNSSLYQKSMDLQHRHELQQQGLLLPSKYLSTFKDWREYAVQLAALTPEKIVDTLKIADPFGVRTFESKLLAAESHKQAFLSLEELRSLFPCPSISETTSEWQQRITLPDQRNMDKARAYRNGTDSYFLFFQHLRKAGGTNFCSLAKHNLPNHQIPKYFCSTFCLHICFSVGWLV